MLNVGLHPLWRATAVAAALLMAACGGGDGPPQPVPFADVEVNAFSSVSAPRQAVASDDAAWAALWAEHTAKVQPAPPRPAVDFTTQSVAAVFVGENTGCERPEIASVERVADAELRVAYRIVAPVGSIPCPAVVTTPVHMVRFSNVSHLPISFRKL